MKKLLAVLLVLCLFVGMMPMMAFADDVADTPQANFENTDARNEGSKDAPSGGNDGGDSGQSGGDDPAIEPDGEDLDTGKGYDADNIQNFKQLQAALKDGLTNIHLGARIDLTTDLTIGDGVIITGAANEPGRVFAGDYKLIINGNVTLNYVGIDASIAEVVVNEDSTLTVNNATVASGIQFSGKGTVVGKDGNLIYDGTNTSTEPGDGDDEQTPPIQPLRYSVEFDVNPYWANASIVVEDESGNVVKPNGNGEYWLEAGVTYFYTVRANGFVEFVGNIDADNAWDTITVDLKLDGPIIVWPYSHGYVEYWISHNRDWAGVRVEPDSGYYLDDLTIYKVGGGTVNYGHWRDNIYYFPLYAGEQYIIDADFASAPSEYRVYVDSSILHGDVSVDTRYAEEGEWVYITVNPNAGYRLSDLTVTRPSGNTVKVEHVRGNVFRFAMPGVRVTVDAEFVRTTMPFTDVSRGQWFYDAVSFVYWRDIMDGVTSTQFAPDATTTRAMVVQILYRMAGSPTVRGSSPFYDVSNGAWYADAVIWAEANDIVNGMTTTTFAPNTAVTREQLATMLYRYAQYRHYNTSAGANTNILSYYDANHISEYAFSALQWACGEGIMDGTGTGYLSPQGQATRAQLAAMLMRFCMEYRI